MVIVQKIMKEVVSECSCVSWVKVIGVGTKWQNGNYDSNGNCPSRQSCAPDSLVWCIKQGWDWREGQKPKKSNGIGVLESNSWTETITPVVDVFSCKVESAWCFPGSDAMGRPELGEDDLLSLWSLSAIKVGQRSLLRWVGQEAWGDWGEMNLINHSTTQSCSHLPAINTQLCFAINKIIFFRWRLTLCTQVWHDLVWFGIVTFYALPSFAR